jgi:hypothetical protein
MDSTHLVQVNCILLNKDTGSFVQPEIQNNIESRKQFQRSTTVQNKSFIPLSLFSHAVPTCGSYSFENETLFSDV